MGNFNEERTSLKLPKSFLCEENSNGFIDFTAESLFSYALFAFNRLNAVSRRAKKTAYVLEMEITQKACPLICVC